MTIYKLNQTQLTPSSNSSRPRLSGKDLFWSILLGCTSIEESLNEFLSSGKSIKFKLASDGGTSDKLGSFGWEIAIGCDEILWQCKGPTFGLNSESFQAESNGFISALPFLQAHTKYYSITIDPDTNHDFLFDSKSLLKCTQQALTHSLANPSHCLASDYDLESGILDILETQVSTC